MGASSPYRSALVRLSIDFLRREALDERGHGLIATCNRSTAVPVANVH